MKSIFHVSIRTIACSAAVIAVSLALSTSARAVDCAAVAERVATAVKASPDLVLTVVEDAMVAYEECACEVVSAAIKNCSGSADMVKQIVLVAVQTAETQAPGIAECAVAAAPQHAEAVRIAFAEAFNGKEGAAVAAAADAVPDQGNASTELVGAENLPVALDGSETLPSMLGKEVLAESLSDAALADMATPEQEVFGAAPLPIGMAFLIPPVSASPVIIPDEPEKEVIVKEKVVTKTRVVTRTVPRTIIRTVPVSPTSP